MDEIDVSDIHLSDGAKSLFIALVCDAPNWQGEPLVGGNFVFNPSDKGYLTHIKKLGLLETIHCSEEDESWVRFSRKGIAYAATLANDPFLAAVGAAPEDMDISWVRPYDA